MPPGSFDLSLGQADLAQPKKGIDPAGQLRTPKASDAVQVPTGGHFILVPAQGGVAHVAERDGNWPGLAHYAQGHQPYPAGIPSSFGIDLVDVASDPSLPGQPLVIEFSGATGAESEFTVQVWYLMDLKDGSQPRPVATQAIPLAVRTEAHPDGHTFLVIPQIRTAEYDKLGLVITRADAKEHPDPSGAYTITLHEPS